MDKASKHKKSRDVLRDYGCKRYTGNSHAEGYNEEEVEHDIDDSSRGEEHQRTLRIPDSTEDT